MCYNNYNTTKKTYSFAKEIKMDLLTQKNSLKHIFRMFDRSASVEPILKQATIKPLCPHTEKEVMPLKRISPEEAGVDSSYIADFLSELISDKNLELHGVVILKDGKIICDAEFGAYKSCYWHAEHSFSKSVTGMAIGMLIDEGKLSLDDKAAKILEKRIPTVSHLTHKGITVRHLITMTSGISFSESGAVVEENWLRSFFESFIKTEPGKTFNYNSMNSYILSCIVKEVSGEGLFEYLKPRLFDPLGITVLNWERAPDGNAIGGWGLYLRREDAAKLALLYLSGGVWRGKRIISESWIKESCKAKIKLDGSTGDFDYGYHVWTGRNENSILFNGMFGQDTIIYPETNTAVIINGGVEQIFQHCSYYKTAGKYFSHKYYSDGPIRRSRRSRKKLVSVLFGISGEKKRRFLKPREKTPKFLLDAVGKTYSVKKNKEKEIIKLESINGTNNIGLLPLVEQVLRNRYTKGISSLSFSLEKRKLLLKVKEGSQVSVLPVSLGKTENTVLFLSETEYHTAVTASSSYDEDGRGVLKLKLSFPEISSSREIKIFFDEKGIEVSMSETPGMGLLKLAAESLADSIKNKRSLVGIVSKIDVDFFYYKLKNTIEPDFWLWEE